MHEMCAQRNHAHCVARERVALYCIVFASTLSLFHLSLRLLPCETYELD